MVSDKSVIDSSRVVIGRERVLNKWRNIAEVPDLGMVRAHTDRADAHVQQRKFTITGVKCSGCDEDDRPPTERPTRLEN